MRNVFSPTDVQIMQSALRRASARFRHHYGFGGTALHTAKMIAATAILNRAEGGPLETDDLAEAATESVRLFLRQASPSQMKRIAHHNVCS